jgi:lysophospholipase L1-like esterase
MKPRVIFLSILYIFYIGGVAIISDFFYVKYLERIPQTRPYIYLQSYLPELHRKSETHGLFYELKPNSKNIMNTAMGNRISVSVNSHGLRGKEIKKKKSGFRVLVLGNSCTFGPNVDDENIYTAIAEKRLVQAGIDAEVLNAGVSAYNIRNEVDALKYKHIKLKPDLIILARVNPDCAIAAVQYLPEDYAQRKLSNRKDGPYYKGVSDKEYVATVLPKQFPLNNILDRWLLLNSGIYRDISLLMYKKRKGLKDFTNFPEHLFGFNPQEVFHDLINYSKQVNVPVVILMLPQSQPQPQPDYFIELFRNLQIPYWNISPALNNQDIFMDGCHYNMKGHRLIGEILAHRLERYLKENKRYPANK